MLIFALNRTLILFYTQTIIILSMTLIIIIIILLRGKLLLKVMHYNIALLH